jgi:SsrA-binding protein
MAGKLIAENRRARFDYFLEDSFEAGIMLTGTEVKSLRNGQGQHRRELRGGGGRQIVLINADIPPYAQANRFNHEPRRPRKLLLHRKEIDKLIGAVQRDGRDDHPDQALLERQGHGQARTRPRQGQEAHDKREVIAPNRDWQRDKAG